MGFEHTPLLLHTEVTLLLRGKMSVSFRVPFTNPCFACKAPIRSDTLFNKYLKVAENGILGIFTKTSSLQKNNISMFTIRHRNASVQHKLEFQTNSIANNKPECFKALNNFLTEPVNELEEVVVTDITGKPFSVTEISNDILVQSFKTLMDNISDFMLKKS
jgi:hypothetical protein